MPVQERPLVEETSDSPRRTSVSVALVFCAIVGVPLLVQPVYELAKGRPLQEFDIFRRAPTLDRIKAFETELTDAGLFVRLARPYTQWLQLALLGQGNEKVVIGRDGWLFFRPNITYATHPPFTHYVKDARLRCKDPFPAIASFARDLRSRGIDLVVVPVPVKPSIYPEKLTALYDESLGPPVNVYAEEFFRRLRQEGITVIDLTRTLWDAKPRGKLYLSMDTHWTPLGMSVFADALAEELVRRHGWLSERLREYAVRPLKVAHTGDIQVMLNLPSWSRMYGKEEVVIEQVLDQATGKLVEPDPGSPIVLLGDSFTNVFSLAEMNWGDHAGLGEHLARRLGRPIDVIAVNGGAPTATRQKFARRGIIAGKKLVVWAFATRELITPDTAWDVVPLPEERARAAEEGRIEVTAEVLAVSRPPRPGEDPYPDALTLTKYKVLSVGSGRYEGGELLAVEWVMRNYKLTAAAALRPGDVRVLTLVPFDQKVKSEPDLDKIKQLDDTGEYGLLPYWVEESRAP